MVVLRVVDFQSLEKSKIYEMLLGILESKTNLMGMSHLLVPIMAMARVHVVMGVSVRVTVGMGVDNITV